MTRCYLAGAFMLALAAAARSAAEPTPCPTPSSTFDLIQRGIFEQHGCTQRFCHGAARQAGLDLRARVSYQSLSNHTDGQDEADDQQYRLVEPGRPEDSLLWLLLAAKTLGRPNVPGTPMPVGAVPLSRDELEGVRLWIAAGAPAQDFVDGVDELIKVCQESSEGADPGLPLCDRNDPSLLLPELHPEPPTDIRIFNQSEHRFIYFTTVIANTGEGPLIIQAAERPSRPGQLVNAEQVILRQDGSKCAHPAGVIAFGEDGRSWQYSHVANFELRRDDPMTGDFFALRSKAYICLLDTDPIPGLAVPNQFEAHCRDEIGRMGISAGWKDTYHRVFPGQWIDLDADPEEPVPPGRYYVVNVANPTNLLWETDASLESNTSYTQVNVDMQDPDPQAAPPPPVVRPTLPADPPPAVQPAPARVDPHQRPTRPPRAPRPLRTVHTPHPPALPHTTRAPRPERPPRPERAPRPERPQRPGTTSAP